jgi:hypothetical protein
MRTDLTHRNSHRPPPAATDAEVYDALVAELRRLDELRPDELHRLSTVRLRAPGTRSQQHRAEHRAVEDGRMYLIKIGSTPYVSLGDETDRQVAARRRARGQPITTVIP